MRTASGTSKRILFVFLFTVVIGCVSSPTNVQLSPATRAEVEGILNTLQARYDLTGSLKIIQMAVTIEEGDQREEVRESLWYKKSESGGELLLIQALGPINEPRAVVIANRDENQFVLALLNEERTYHGPLSDGALKEIFGVDLRVSDVLSAIFANPFLDRRTDNFTSVENSGAKFTITRPGIKDGHVETVTLFVREGEPRVTDWHIHDKNGVLQQRATFSDYRKVGGILRPHKVEIKRPIEQTRVAVNIAKVELNVEIKDSKFDAARFLSEDFEIIPLSELAD
ncbi:MAG: hypothetical protein OXI63_26615 [Candidatus Poribacteria bacterium]|nr:hypothetical protein [Candidatus Poribacteria bacterium]